MERGTGELHLPNCLCFRCDLLSSLSHQHAPFLLDFGPNRWLRLVLSARVAEGTTLNALARRVTPAPTLTPLFVFFSILMTSSEHKLRESCNAPRAISANFSYFNDALSISFLAPLLTNVLTELLKKCSDWQQVYNVQYTQRIQAYFRSDFLSFALLSPFGGLVVGSSYPLRCQIRQHEGVYSTSVPSSMTRSSL